MPSASPPYQYQMKRLKSIPYFVVRLWELIDIKRNIVKPHFTEVLKVIILIRKWSF